MEDVIRKYTKEKPSTQPAFIVFINDGGVVKPTKKVIVESSTLLLVSVTASHQLDNPLFSSFCK
ncbi:hypothetical protein BK127_26045 [Paenibacillus sp. FSL H7-0331]|nr:hypothetical protein BK127_26045 [Paenibacillus sp. FSL H7-0331]